MGLQDTNFNYCDVPQPSMALNALWRDRENGAKTLVPGALQFANTMEVDPDKHDVAHVFGHARNIGRGAGRMNALAIHCHGGGYPRGLPETKEGRCGFGYELLICTGGLHIGKAALLPDLTTAFKVIIFASCATAEVSIPGGAPPSKAGGSIGIGDGVMFCKAVARAAGIPVLASNENQHYPSKGPCPFGMVPMQGQWLVFRPSEEPQPFAKFPRFSTFDDIARRLDLAQCR
ncbi:MAG: hypothetical protein LAQ69_32620 [Acidobacteriia bacterium]|nr:hypothetical protein [Terriglobia bacterium]